MNLKDTGFSIDVYIIVLHDSQRTIAINPAAADMTNPKRVALWFTARDTHSHDDPASWLPTCFVECWGSALTGSGCCSSLIVLGGTYTVPEPLWS